MEYLNGKLLDILVKHGLKHSSLKSALGEIKSVMDERYCPRCGEVDRNIKTRKGLDTVHICNDVSIKL